MAKLNLSDQTIIQHYQERRQVLNEELQRIDSILNALSNEATSTGAPARRKYGRRKATAAQAAPASAKATKATRGPGRPKAAKAAKAATAPQAARPTKGRGRSKAAASPKAPTLSWDDKVEQTLAKIGPAEKDRIVQFIASNDPSTTADKARKALTLRLAVMEKVGKLKKESNGDQQLYRLP